MVGLNWIRLGVDNKTNRRFWNKFHALIASGPEQPQPAGHRASRAFKANKKLATH